MTPEEHVKYLRDQCIMSAVYGSTAGFLIACAIFNWGRDSATYAAFMGPWFIYLFIKDLRNSIKKLRKILAIEDSILKINN